VSPSWAFDHAALTVPDLEAAVAFFAAVAGARELYRRTVEPRSDRAAMQTNYGAHPDAGFRLAKLDVGGAPVELFEYDAPDQRTEAPRNCDLGGHHLGFLVADLAAAIAAVRDYPGTEVLGEVSTLPADHPLARRSWIYFLTPWGQQLELVCDSGRRPRAEPE
jgi:catechol 2,3-dioxygenase-like lactoylglutathione lyase family enzyme